MSDLDEATENPNDKMPPGRPLDPKKVVDEEFADDQGDEAPEADKHGIERSNDLTSR